MGRLGLEIGAVEEVIRRVFYNKFLFELIFITSASLNINELTIDINFLLVRFETRMISAKIKDKNGTTFLHTEHNRRFYWQKEVLNNSLFSDIFWEK